MKEEDKNVMDMRADKLEETVLFCIRTGEEKCFLGVCLLLQDLHIEPSRR